MFADALSLAVNVTHAHLEETGWVDQPGWRTVRIRRLLDGSGWLVASNQASIHLDKWMEAA